jgi:hypothetical protein
MFHLLRATVPYTYALRHSYASSALGSVNRLYLVTPADDQWLQHYDTMVSINLTAKNGCNSVLLHFDNFSIYGHLNLLFPVFGFEGVSFSTE